MSELPPSPEKILQHTLQGHAAAAALGAAATHSLFTHIDRGAATAAEIAGAAAISLRGAQALLDAVVALGLVHVADGRYTNSEEASFYLVEGKPAYLGAQAKLVLSPFGRGFANIADVARTGVPTFEHTADVSDNPFWEELVLAIVPLALPVAHALIERVGFAKMTSPSMLDIGGGSGVFAAVLLESNATATATQLDWPAVNRIGERFVARRGVASRFKTIDGDFHSTDFGEGLYDVIIYSNIAHQESPADNVAVFRKGKRALKPGGVFVISDFVLNDDRTSTHPWTGIFHTIMLLQSKAGAAWRQADYRSWLGEAGFANVTFSPTATPSTLILAK
ncbi:MAG TPA: methyltransferase [Tepidisphaeraceae bacterium]|nr:methyltransferase [Tepidisphaeraceae bacterium]